jgi:hypothetical protein
MQRSITRKNKKKRLDIQQTAIIVDITNFNKFLSCGNQDSLIYVK